MNLYDISDVFEQYGPLASTEEKSIHDNITLNKQSLEKGLKNRPNHNALVARGILRNPGKAFSDRMSQLDLAKKRDKLKAKIANRPEREELVRKLILQEQNENRQKKLDQIKQRLGDCINNRPGSLELVGKNILQVDRLLASRIQCGEITYPKVIGGDGNVSDSFSSNHSTPLPSISEIDISNTLNELSDLQSQASTSSTKPSTKNLQYKKTYRVGRYSFHNIEFRPAAQKAREYQQNELVQFEEIQAQRNPNLKKLHSELAIKSHHNNEISTSDNGINVPKHSLLHRLNVHELKSECKIRMISCSNIPKVQLVEKLLPYESEILASHTSFDSGSRTGTGSQSNRRSMPVMKCTQDFSPPESNNSFTFGQSFGSSQNTDPSLSNHVYVSENCTKLIHSHSEPLIPNFTNPPTPVSFVNRIQFFPVSTAGVQTSNFTCINNFTNQQAPINQFNPNNSYPSLNYNQQNMSLNFDNFSLRSNNLMLHSNLYNSMNNSWADVNNPSIQMHNSGSTGPSDHSFEDSLNGINSKSEMMSTNSSDYMILTPDMSSSSSEIGVSQAFNIDCGSKFDFINKEISKLNFVINRMRSLTLQKDAGIQNRYFEQFIAIKTNLIKLVNEMMEFINNEIKFKTIDVTCAQNQKNWLKNLLVSIDNNFQSYNSDYVKLENRSFAQSNRLTEDAVNNNNNNNNTNGIHYVCHDTGLDDIETMSIEPMNTISNQNPNECFYSQSFNGFKEEEMDQFNLSDLNIPGTPLSDFMNSPLCNEEFDDFMYDLLNVTENVIS